MTIGDRCELLVVSNQTGKIPPSASLVICPSSFPVRDGDRAARWSEVKAEKRSPRDWVERDRFRRNEAKVRI